MIKLIVRLKNKNKTEELEKYGTIFYRSPILNVIGIEIREECIDDLKRDINVLSCEIEPNGRLMPV